MKEFKGWLEKDEQGELRGNDVHLRIEEFPIKRKSDAAFLSLPMFHYEGEINQSMASLRKEIFSKLRRDIQKDNIRKSKK